MIESEVVTSVTDDVRPLVDESDVTATRSRDPDDVTAGDDAFLAGFCDCRREALRYLRQRNVSVGDELERHLAAVERTLLRRDDPTPTEDDRRPVAESRRPHDGDDSALGVSLVTDDDDADEDVNHEEQAGQSDVSEQAQDLLRLAQNNPRINNILNELFTLMDDDDDDDDDCLMTCDDDDDVKHSHDDMTSHDVVDHVS